MKETILFLENLNKLRLTDAERQRTIACFEALAADAQPLCAYSTDAQPMVHNVPLTNVLREDVARQVVSRDALLEGAPEQRDGYFVVPRVLD